MQCVMTLLPFFVIIEMYSILIHIYIMHWLSAFFYMEVKFGPIEERTKDD